MKIQFLKYFCVLAEELHFRRAAARLAISQPPLSAAIQALEDELGMQLFARTSRMVQLTPAGAAFLVEAQEVLERVSRMPGVVRAAGAGMQGRLDVGIAASLMYRDVPKILARFSRQAPRVELVLHELSSAEQIDKLTRRQIHAAFVLGASVPAQLKALPLRSDLYAVCLSDKHRLASRARIDLLELADESIVMFSREIAPANHDNVIATFSRAGVHPQTVHSARTWTTIVSMVAHGYGVALVPKTMGRAGITGVRFVPHTGPSTEAPAMLAWNPELFPKSLEGLISSAAGFSGKRKPA